MAMTATKSGKINLRMTAPDLSAHRPRS
jgi:hypothetical protein